MGFRAPIGDITFAIDTATGGGQASENWLPADVVQAVLAEAGRFASEELAPLNQVGDRVGVKFDNGAVTTAPGWRAAYRHFAAGGWLGISASEEFGGQELPKILEMAAQDLWNASCAAFAVCPMLTVGAIEAISAHAASPELKRRYLPKLVSGDWTATMNLTEPEAGSDLSGIRTRAERATPGTYRITGQKIFITYGEHDIAENIVHLVLARLPDAPAGTAGISLFLVPKFLDGADGGLGERNAVAAAGIEEKLGLHGSPTCTMVYDGATGFLVGEEHRGLACMFTMMNLARLSVGIQGVGVAERATQEAFAYARERRQGRAPGAGGPGMSPIIEHPDVAAMLMRMKAMTQAARTLCYACAHAIDMSRMGSAAERGDWHDRASLITPLAKAFATDAAIEVASLGVQVHGGAGYIEKTGAAQHLRDARIFAIYEGTNGIQAIDLVLRKLKLADGAAAGRLVADIAAIAAAVAADGRPELGATGRRLESAARDLAAATEHIAATLAAGRQRQALAVATPYLRLFAITLAGALLAKGALTADTGKGQAGHVAIARRFAETVVVETSGLHLAVTESGSGLEDVMSVIAGSDDFG